MSDRDAYEPGVPCWVTTIQPDPEAAASFYGELFGWQYDRGGGYLVARHRGKEVAAVAPLPPGVKPAPPADWITSVCVDSAADAAEAAQGAGGSVLAEPFDDEPAGRAAVIADPAGAVVSLWQPGARQGARVVNEPGAWAMSRLDTPDSAGAERFYGRLFGWTTETFDMGEASITMFRLPGYVGGEPEQPVSREVVATMAPTPGGEPAHWSVDFWVHDANGAAAKAEELGGAVVAAPSDTEVMRTAVLADPAGAVFSVSQLAAAA